MGHLLTLPLPHVLNDLQSQLHDSQASLASHVNKVHMLANMFVERNAIKCGVEVLWQLMEKSSGFVCERRGREGCKRDREGEKIFSVGVAVMMMGGVLWLSSPMSWRGLMR